MNRINHWFRMASLVSCLALACGGAASGGAGAQEPGGDPNPEEVGEVERGEAAASPSPSGAEAPDFTLEDLDGDEFHLSEHIGDEVILLNFWATWCEPCRIEMPHLDRIQREYRDQDLRIVAISMDGPESVARVRPHVSRYDFSFTVLLDQESEVTQIYNPRRAAPFNALIGRSGSIVWSHEGYSPGDEQELEAQIRQALGLTAE